MPNKTKLGRNVGPFHTNAFSFENEYISMSLDLPTSLIRGGPVHTNAFSFENEYISMSLDLPTSLIRGGPVHTNAFSKVCFAVVIENASIDSRLHYRFDVFSTVHTKTFENDRMARWDVS